MQTKISMAKTMIGGCGCLLLVVTGGGDNDCDDDDDHDHHQHNNNNGYKPNAYTRFPFTIGQKYLRSPKYCLKNEMKLIME